jgi:hypothetical protein
MNTDNNRAECLEAFKKHCPFSADEIAWSVWKMAWQLKPVSSPSPVKEIENDGWILSRERMPEFDGMYYVYGFMHHPCGNVTPFHKIVECKFNQWVKSDVGEQMTSWRPLLNPPTEKGEKEPTQEVHSIRCASYTSEGLRKRGHVPGACDCKEKPVKEIKSAEEILRKNIAITQRHEFNNAAWADAVTRVDYKMMLTAMEEYANQFKP